MRAKIFGTLIMIILVLTSSFALISERALVRGMLTEHENNLKSELYMAESLLSYSYEENYNFQEYVDKVRKFTGARVTLIAKDGVVIADSHEASERMNNHLNREEIIKARESGAPSAAKRFSNTTSSDFLYLAHKIEIDGIDLYLRLAKPLVDIEELTQKIKSYAVGAISISVVIAGIIAFILTRRITDPLYQMTIAANELANGEYGKKIYNNSRDQIQILTEAFNKMSVSLEKSVSDITNRNIELESILNSMINGIIAVDKNRNILMINSISFEILGLPADYVAENESMYKIVRNEELIEMIEVSMENGTSQIKELSYIHLDKILRIYINPIRTAAEDIIGSIIVIQDISQIRKLEKMRSDFVSNVSHELKTPLTSIKGFVDTLKQGAINDRETAMRFLDIIEIESDRLHRLISDILVLSEIESMDKELDIVEIDLGEVAREVVDFLKYKAVEKSIEIKCEINNAFKISANRDRIKQLFINLIDNAIKYTENGEIKVSIEFRNQWISIKIKDTGIGFADEHKDRLFERFYRVDKGRSRNQGGTGLGLSIVKHIVLLYKGKIFVESTPGKGTEFEILFPANRNI